MFKNGISGPLIMCGCRMMNTVMAQAKKDFLANIPELPKLMEKVSSERSNFPDPISIDDLDVEVSVLEQEIQEWLYEGFQTATKFPILFPGEGPVIRFPMPQPPDNGPGPLPDPCPGIILALQINLGERIFQSGVVFTMEELLSDPTNGTPTERALWTQLKGEAEIEIRVLGSVDI